MKVRYLLPLLISLSLLIPQYAFASKLPGTFDCELSFKNQITESFLIYCADGNEMITRIKWEKWDRNGASGYGYHVWNDCSPDCVDGKTHSVRVRVLLLKPISLKKNDYFTRLKWWEIDSSMKMKKYGQSGELDLYQNFKDMGGRI